MQTPPSEPAKEPANQLWLLPFLLLGVAVSLLAAFWFTLRPMLDQGPGANPPPPVMKLSRDETLLLIEQKNHAIGHLENLEFAAADQQLTNIIRLVPADPFGPRNLAICRQLALDKLDKNRDPTNFEQMAARAKESIELAKASEPESFIPHVIAARVALKQEQTDAALNDLREAVRLNPQSVGASYDLFSLLQTTPGDAAAEESFRALQSVFQREPNNLFVIKDWLPLMAQRREPEFAATLKQVQETIAPFVETIKVNTRVDLNEIIDKGLAATQEGNWQVAQRSTTIIKNLIIAEAARDKRFVMLDSLEYVLADFGPEFRSRSDLPSSGETRSNPVHFLPPHDFANWPQFNGGRQVSAVDFDLNGQLDLLVLQPDFVTVWGHERQNPSWDPLARIETSGSYTGAIVCDLDDDIDQELKTIPGMGQPADALRHEAFMQGLCHTADPDLILFGPAGLKLIENRKEPKSEARTLVARSGGAAFDEVRDIQAAAVADLDNDGDLDLIVSTPKGLRLFSNRGNLSFEEITPRSMLPPPDVLVTALAIVDWDHDSDIDVLVATTAGVGWLENVRHGRLRYRPIEELAPLQGASSLQAGDFDGNTSWDLIAAGPKGARLVLTQRTPSGMVSTYEITMLAEGAFQSAHVGDFDNDSASDVLLLGTSGASLRMSDGQGLFSTTPTAVAGGLKGTESMTVADFDRDGDLDLFTTNHDGWAFLSSQCRESDNPNNQYLEIQLLGYTVKPGEQNSDKRTNHINLGGMLELKSGQRYQAKVVTEPLTHFGLGAQEHADVVRILWTNGIPTNVVDPVPDEPICIEQKLNGSCPYLYTWDGERFVFVTDLLWNAPLGLKFAESVVAPWREWEYIKIDGRQLKEANHEYQLRVTAELWEAEYFDQFKLFAIDHPAGTDIFTNEKVGPATIAAPQIHTVQNPRRPVAATDTRGRDVLGQILSRDQDFTKTFDIKRAQGFTEEHHLELDLGPFPAAQKVMLYLTGWMYPGSTSLSVQLSQNPDLPKPRPPALSVPDAQGEWREVRPFMGFPGGKTKTIAVDLSNLFSGDDHRLRIVSTMELYWDSVFFTVDDAPVEVRETELTLMRAELVDRGGVSFHSWPTHGNGPDQFDYQHLVPGEQWPAMSGHFTRLGDVLPLLKSRDDQLVVTGSGDEIRLGFAAPQAPLPPGWVRDFVLYTVGWDKDADLNTVYGDTVEPLPFEGMTVYAHRDGELRPLDPAYQAYLREYQTRQRNPNPYWKSLQQWKRGQK
ncbi:MAG: hypothetical protein DWI02_01395 [Planctomycetota bacterium]|jgi:hypothetical protein|nr:MAG: hypothetical protein DWI02_01395 [Planctomycetota bacterium]